MNFENDCQSIALRQTHAKDKWTAIELEKDEKIVAVEVEVGYSLFPTKLKFIFATIY